MPFETARPIHIATSIPSEGREKVSAATSRNVPYYMTVNKLSEYNGQHPGSIRRGIAEGRIPATKVNGRCLICRDDVFPNYVEGVSNADNKP